MVEYKDPVAEQIKAYILDDPPFSMDIGNTTSEPGWHKLRSSGSRIWLHGSEELAAGLWSREISAYYLSNRSLLNSLETDSPEFPLIAKANQFLKGLPEKERTQEILFIIHAKRILRVSRMLSARIITEIPAADESAEDICRYIRRLYQIAPETISPVLPYTKTNSSAAAALCPDKIPLTLSGIRTPEEALMAAGFITRGIILQAPPGVTPESLAWDTMAALKAVETETKAPDLIINGVSGEQELISLSGFPVINLHVNIASTLLHQPGSNASPLSEMEASERIRTLRSDDFYQRITARL